MTQDSSSPDARPEDSFEDAFQAAYHQIFMRCARRLPSEADRLSMASMAVMQHLAASGPLTLGEMALHLDRAPSTLSEMIDGLERSGHLSRQRDTRDRRRVLIWLTPGGLARLEAARTPLDPALLAELSPALSADDQRQLITLLTKLLTPKGSLP